MAYRSRPILKDPWAGPGSLDQWKISSTRRKPLHGVFIVGAPSSALLQNALHQVKTTPGINCVAIEEGYRLGPADRPTEHFGFRDGVAKPGVAVKLASRGSHDSKIVPEDATSVFSVDHLLVQAAQPQHDGTSVSAGDLAAPAWAHNGSFLVYRRLNQEVTRFRRMTRQWALRYESPLAEDEAAAMLIGRAKDGTSLEDAGPASSASVGDPDAFDYSHDRCPAFAHTRKVNPRLSHREAPPLFRRGVVFGNPVPSTADGAEMEGAEEEERGLHFMCYQSSIERQFETISRWMNHPDFPAPEAGVDGLLGRPSSDPWPVDRPVGSFRLTEFVFVSGGEYFFAPSLSGLRALCDT